MRGAPVEQFWRSCWSCGVLLSPNAAGPSYCAACETFTGTGLPSVPSSCYPWRRADGSTVLEMYLDHSAVHAPSPA